MWSFLGPLEIDLRGERVIAAARLVLAVACLVSPIPGLIELEGVARAAPTLAGLFVGYSIAAMAWLLAARRFPSVAGGILLCADLVWFSSLIFVGGGGSNPYPILYVFVLLSAGLRWGMRETLVCAGICSLFSVLFPLALAQTHLDLPLPGPVVTANWLDLNDVLMRTVALLVVGYLIGYLAEREKRVRRGLNQLAQTLAASRVDQDLSPVLAGVMTGIRELFRASKVVVLYYDYEEDELLRCELAMGVAAPEIKQMPHSEVGEWADLARPEVLPASIAGKLGTRKFHWTPFHYRGQLGWLFVVEPQARQADEPVALQQVADQMGPVLDRMFLLNRIRRETAEEERNRIASDFHDGPLQSFYSFEMYLEVLQRWMESDAARAAQELVSLRESAHRQSLSMREFVHNMRPVQVEAATLLTQLQALADEIQKTCDVKIFVTSHTPIIARRRLCREVYQMVREALNNIRKHAQASNATVTLQQSDEWLIVVIDDDGVGFSFQGTYDLDQLDDLRLGPISIKRRVRAAGGQLTVKSHLGVGCKLVIRMPLERRAPAQELQAAGRRATNP